MPVSTIPGRGIPMLARRGREPILPGRSLKELAAEGIAALDPGVKRTGPR
jgi:hypothetical protein